MAQKTSSLAGARPDRSREERLKAALKANLARRKAQAKARGERDTGQAGDTEEQD